MHDITNLSNEIAAMEEVMKESRVLPNTLTNMLFAMLCLAIVMMIIAVWRVCAMYRKNKNIPKENFTV